MFKYLFVFIILFATTAFAGLSQADRKALFKDATQKLKEAKIESKVLKVGDTFPNLKFMKKMSPII